VIDSAISASGLSDVVVESGFSRSSGGLPLTLWTRGKETGIRDGD